MDTYHLIANARPGRALALDDHDRFELLDRAGEALRPALLAYCLMTTHLHLVLEGRRSELVRLVRGVLTAHARAFNRRQRHDGPLFRDGVEIFLRPPPLELANAIRYVHRNPTRTDPPIVPCGYAYRASSQREYAGLRLEPRAAVARARALVGSLARRVEGPLPELADAGPLVVPVTAPALLLAAAAEAYGRPIGQVAGSGRAEVLFAARALFLRLGRLESYRLAQLVPLIGVSESQARRIEAARPVGDRAVRVARTFLRDPALLETLGADARNARIRLPAAIEGPPDARKTRACQARPAVRVPAPAGSPARSRSRT